MLGTALAVTVAATSIMAEPKRPSFPLRLEDLTGRAVAPQSGPVILAFWRADCGPCLIELRGAQDYAVAGAPSRVLFVGLQDASALRQAALKAGAPLALVVRAAADPQAVLTAFGGAPPRLPLAVALDARGAVCAHHTGLLGTDRVRAWVHACGSGHAGG